jgi:hypothetical protein
MLKNQSARNCSKMDSLRRSRPHDPNQLEQAQTEFVWMRYHVLFVFTNMENVDCVVRLYRPRGS